MMFDLIIIFLVSVALLVPKVAPPVGPLKLNRTVSLFSAVVSPVIVTVNVLAAASPFAQLSVPLAAV